MSTASVVIVGAGVVGASIASHLAARGWRNVRVLERASRAGQGSTHNATGGFRSFFPTAVNVRLSLLARKKLGTFREETGIDPGFRANGYLWLARSAGEMEALRRVRDLHAREGQTSDIELPADSITGDYPWIDVSEVFSAIFCPSAGVFEPMRILEGYVAAARARGVVFDFDVEVVALRRDPKGRIRSVVTSREDIAADFVVNAAGAWAAPLAAYAGVELPVTPLRRQVAVTESSTGLPDDIPMTIWIGDGFHLRVRDGRTLLLFPSAGNADDPYATNVEPGWIATVQSLASRRIPVLRQASIDLRASYAGLYEMSPDRHALLGAAPGCDNFYLANGSSGHGVMHAPAFGQLVAEMLSDGAAHTIAVDALRPSRFLECAPNPTDHLL